MSVLRCDRNGCENIMCDRYSTRYGYICYDCFEELLSKTDISFGDFMNSIKQDEVDGRYHKDKCLKEFTIGE